MRLTFKDTKIDTGYIVYNSVIEDFGIVIRQNEGYNVLHITRGDQSYTEIEENYLIYTKPLTIDEIKRDNKVVPTISIV